MASWPVLNSHLAKAMGDQGFRPVAMDALPDPVVHFVGKTGDAELDSALIGLSQGRNWPQVGVQLAQFANTRGFVGAFLRRDRVDLQLAIVQAWSGVVDRPFAESQLDHAWDIHKQLSRFVHDFHLSDETKAQARAVLSRFTGGSAAASEPTTAAPAAKGWDINLDEIRRASEAAPGSKPGASALAANPYELPVAVALLILRLILDVADAGRAVGTLVIAAPEGLSESLTEGLTAMTGIWKGEQFAMSPAQLFLAGVDAETITVHGYTGIGSLALSELQRSLRYYAAG